MQDYLQQSFSAVLALSAVSGKFHFAVYGTSLRTRLAERAMLVSFALRVNHIQTFIAKGKSPIQWCLIAIHAIDPMGIRSPAGLFAFAPES
jgi:hypothetical protein